jgi:hypothetical protein
MTDFDMPIRPIATRAEQHSWWVEVTILFAFAMVVVVVGGYIFPF